MAQYDGITYEVRQCEDDDKSCVITMRIPYDGNVKSLGAWKGEPAWTRVMAAHLIATRGLFHALRLPVVSRIFDTVMPKILLALFENELPQTMRDVN